MKTDLSVAMPFVSLLDRKPRNNDKVGCSCGWQVLCFHTFLTAISKLIMQYCNCKVAFEMAGLARYEGTFGTFGTPPLQ